MATQMSLSPAAVYPQGVLVDRLMGKSQVSEFFDNFRANYRWLELIRVGGPGDGGYLVPDILDSVSACFSPGVDQVASFESELSSVYRIPSFMADASVDSPPISDERFSFEKKFLGAKNNDTFMTLGSWIERCAPGRDDLLLQMDIEGGEYDVLTFESEQTLAKFKCMAIEFHNADRLLDRCFYRFFCAIFEKIFANFSVCHVHPNNCCGVASFDGVEIPRVFEVTFIRNDMLNAVKPLDVAERNLPNILDEKNVPHNDDIRMPKIWWAE